MIIFFVTCLLLLCFAKVASACTTVIVGRKASADGSHFVGRTTDSPTFCMTKLTHLPATKSEKLVAYLDKTVNCEFELPRVGYECIALPISQTISEGNASDEALRDFWWESVINEKRVGISATETTNTRQEALQNDPFVKSGVREGNIPLLVIPYINSAREGVERLGKLVEDYGMMAAEAVIFIDDNEIWYMEIYTGHHYAAQRLPEDCCACIGNDDMLGFYDENDKENWIASAGIVEYAKKSGIYTELDGKFHLALSFGTPKRDYSQLRAWAGRRHFAPSIAGEYDANRQYEIFFKPEKKITLLDAFELTRDRHNGTPQATDKPGNNTRPIAIDRTSQSHFLQYRNTSLAPIMWSCYSAPEFSTYFPVLGIPNKIPTHFDYYKHEYDPNSYMWKLFEIADLATVDRQTYSSLVRDKFSALEKHFVASLASLDDDFKAHGANDLLLRVTEKVEAEVNKVRTELLETYTKKRIEDTRYLGVDQVK